MKIRLAILLRVLGFTLGGIVAVVAALAIMVWISFDADRTAQVLTRHFKDVHQRNLMLSQPPQLRIWPRPTLLLKRSALSDVGRSEPFVSADRLRLELAALPLLRGEFELRGVVAEGVNARLQRNRKGEWNFADLLDAPASDLPGWQSRLQSVKVLDARLAIERTGQSERILVRDLGIEARLPTATDSGSLSWHSTLSETTSESDISFRGNARLLPSAGPASGKLAKLQASLDGNGYGLQGSSAQLSASSLEWDRWGADSLLTDMQLTLRGAAGAQSIDFSAQAPSLDWRRDTLDGRGFKARLALRTVAGQSEFRLDLPELQATAPRGFRSPNGSLEWQLQGQEGSSKGQVQLALFADPLAPLLKVDRLSGEASLQHPRLRSPGATARLEGSLSLQPGSHDVALQAALGDDVLQLKARLQQLWPLNGRSELTATSLDLDRLLAKPGADAPKASPGLPGLGQHKLSGELRIAGLKLGGLQFSSLQSPFLIDKEQLLADGFVARLYGGEVSGKLLAEPAATRLSAQGDFRALPLAQIARAGALPIPLGGDLSGSYRLGILLKPGQPPVTSLTGAVRWSLADAELNGLDLARGLQELAPAIASGRMSARSPGKNERSELGAASSRFVFEQGRLSAERIEARSKWLKLGGSGQADLTRSEMDFSLQAELLPGAPKELASLRGKPLPLRLKGALMHPDLRYEPGPLRPPAPPAKK